MKWLIGSAAVVGTVAFVTSLVFFISVPLPTEVSDSSTKSDGLSEGIQVHGDWVIEVHDSDGTLVEKRVFENEFTGGTTLEKILTHEKRAGLWSISLRGANGLQLAFPPTYIMTEPTSMANMVGPGIKSVAVSSGGDGIIILQAEFIVSEAMKEVPGIFSGNGVDRVHTMLALCEFETTSSDCLHPSIHSHVGIFTSKWQEPTINAEEGQKVIVTVTITFS
ncbi:MAG: hypothetical protein BZY82_01680 [SAR202 cluster bacterium Io17-Chloro-G3]|nr:MAG: hypothetical protein BZY82_01680 [SAR202 cluster bacterium Io17-Chloro-G3]